MSEARTVLINSQKDLIFILNMHKNLSMQVMHTNVSARRKNLTQKNKSLLKTKNLMYIQADAGTFRKKKKPNFVLKEENLPSDFMFPKAEKQNSLIW